ncbi:MAG TPA: DUF1854 domain-containing protein [Polyangiaceae bacterium]|jgi:hypothetical protein
MSLSSNTRPTAPEIKSESVRWLAPNECEFHWQGGAAPVRLTLQGDRSYLRIFAVRAFPQTYPEHFIELVAPSEEGQPKERIGMLESLDGLSANARQALAACLQDGYQVPRLTRILNIRELRHLYQWEVETDRGRHHFEMDSVDENLRLVDGKRVVVRDTDENRYEIRDLSSLDDRSRTLLSRYL